MRSFDAVHVSEPGLVVVEVAAGDERLPRTDRDGGGACGAWRAPGLDPGS
ncbi:DUF6207 family protein [Streptomyces sp. NPDC058409]